MLTHLLTEFLLAQKHREDRRIFPRKRRQWNLLCKDWQPQSAVMTKAARGFARFRFAQHDGKERKIHFFSFFWQNSRKKIAPCEAKDLAQKLQNAKIAGRRASEGRNFRFVFLPTIFRERKGEAYLLRED